MSSWPRANQGVALVAGTACFLAVAIAWAVYMRSPQTKTNPRKKRSTSLQNSVSTTHETGAGQSAPENELAENHEQKMASAVEGLKVQPVEETICVAMAAATTQKSADLQSADGEVVTDDAGRLDSGIGSPKGTPTQPHKGRYNLAHRLDAPTQSTPSHYSPDEALNAVCFSPLASPGIDSSSLRVEVSTISLGDVDHSGSDLGLESGSTTNSVEIPTGDMALLNDTYSHNDNSEPAEQLDQSSSTSPTKSSPCSPEKHDTKQLEETSHPPAAAEDSTNESVASAEEVIPAKETPVKQKVGHNSLSNANNSASTSRNSQKHLNNNNNPTVASNNNNSNKSRSPEHSKKKAGSQESGEQRSPSKDGRKPAKDNAELSSNGGKATATPSSKRKSGSQSSSVTNATQGRRPTSNWASDVEEKQNGTDPRRHSSGSDVAADDKSEGSADSGKGGSDCPAALIVPPTVFEFELPTDLCGRLIGRQGQVVKTIKNKTGATVTVRPHAFQESIKTVYVVGQADDVSKALAEIRNRFPPKQFPQVVLEPPKTPKLQMVTLPPGPAMAEVRVCSIDAANAIFLQLVKNSDIIDEIDAQMALLYGPASRINAPPLGVQLCPGSVCVTVQDGVAFRALLVATDPITVKYVDAGGYGPAQLGELKQIRSDVLGYPFQAVEMVLANIEPQTGRDFTPEAMAATHQFVMGVQQAGGRFFANVTRCDAIVTYGDLIGQMRDQSTITLSDHLVQEGHARWRTDPDQATAAMEPLPPGTEASLPAFSPADFPQLNATSGASW